MSNNLDEAPTLNEKESMKQEMEQKVKIVLDKYFQGRDYDKENVNLWKNYALEELSDFLKNNYKEYGFGIFMIIIKKGDIRTDSNGLLREETDSYFLKSLETKSMYVEIRIFFYKLFDPEINFLDSFNEDLVIKMNELLISKLEGETFSYEFAKDKVAEIVIELQKFLLIPKLKPCSFQVSFILSKPIDYQFVCKTINLNYIPLTASYSNESFYAQLILFILNN